MAASRRSDILFFFAIVLALYLAWRIWDVLLLIYVSALLAVVLSPAIEAVERLHIGSWHPRRGGAVALIVLVVLVAILVFALLIVPPIFHDATDLVTEAPRRLEDLYGRIRTLPFAAHFNPSDLQSSLGRALGGSLGLFKGIAGGVAGFSSGLVLTIYFIFDGKRAFAWAMTLVPSRHRARLESTLLRAELRLRRWLVGQAVMMLILGVYAAVAFGLLHVRYFYAIAVVSGVANIVPIVGPIVSVTLACLVAAFDSWGKVAGVLVAYFIYQQVEHAFITPRIMRFSVDLPALAVIIALAVGGTLAGVLGALIAVPTAALIAVLLEEYFVQKEESAGFSPPLEDA